MRKTCCVVELKGRLAMFDLSSDSKMRTQAAA